MLIDLIRHGEPVGGRRYRGQIDDPLSERGWQQMWSAVAGQQPWDVIVTSTLSRCREFALALGQRHGIEVIEEARIVEIGFGEWEGHTAGEICHDAPDRLQRFYRDPVAARPAGAERLDDFASRVGAAWRALQQQYTEGHVLVVTHAGVIRAITTLVLGMPISHMFRLQVSNAGISRIRLDADRPPVLQLHNGNLPPE
jgi:alpha-ribazole phosphatase/probable phosphoglycerate mutase